MASVMAPIRKIETPIRVSALIRSSSFPAPTIMTVLITRKISSGTTVKTHPKNIMTIFKLILVRDQIIERVCGNTVFSYFEVKVGSR